MFHAVESIPYNEDGLMRYGKPAKPFEEQAGLLPRQNTVFRCATNPANAMGFA